MTAHTRDFAPYIVPLPEDDNGQRPFGMGHLLDIAERDILRVHEETTAGNHELAHHLVESSDAAAAEYEAHEEAIAVGRAWRQLQDLLRSSEDVRGAVVYRRDRLHKVDLSDAGLRAVRQLSLTPLT